MPELPEVEIIKLGLQKKIIGLKIQKIQILSPKSFIGNPNLAEGQIVLKVWRRAKLLVIDLAEGTGYSEQGTVQKSSKLKTETCNLITILFHLKMSGQLIWMKTQNSNVKTQNYNSKLKTEDKIIGGHPTPDMLGGMPNPHTRVIFSFADGSHLYFNDQRKFGWVRVVDSGQVTGDSSIKNLGPEPLQKGFTWQILKSNLLHHKSMAVKVAIMDQSVVAGVGNIYSNEACFNARLDPRRKVGDMSDVQFQALHDGIVKALKDGIKHGGSTRVHFVDAEGHKGYFLDYANVYWKEGYPCKGCTGKVKKITLGGRGTYFCPACQS